MAGKVYVGDINTEIRIDMQEDLTGYNSVKLRVKKPDTSVVEWSPTVAANAATGLMSTLKYFVQENDLNLRGIYKIQPYIKFTGGWEGRGSTIILEVFDSYQ